MSNEQNEFFRWLVYVEPIGFKLAGGLQLLNVEDTWMMTTAPAWPGDKPLNVPVSGPVWSTTDSLTVTVFDNTYTFVCNDYDPDTGLASGIVNLAGEDDGTWTAQGQTGGGPFS